MRKRWLETLHRMALKNPEIVFVGSDLTADAGMTKFRNEVPDRFFMEGISEAHLVSMAAGMAASGKTVYFNTIATFITRRCYEQIVIDLGLTKAKVRLLGNGGGLVYAPLGPTHLAIEDISIMRSIPNMTVIAPADADEMQRAVEASEDYPGPIYFRVAKGGDPIVSKSNPPFEIGKAILHLPPGKVLLISTGILLQTALSSAEELMSKGISAGVLHVPTIKPLDEQAILSAIRESQCVLTLEEHVLSGGLGSAVTELIAENQMNRPLRFKRLGLPDLFPDQYGSQNSLLAKYGLTKEDIVEAAKQLLTEV